MAEESPWAPAQLNDIYCARCNRGVEYASAAPRHDRDAVSVTVRCHGERHTATIANQQWFGLSPLDARVLLHTKFPFLDSDRQEHPAPATTSAPSWAEVRTRVADMTNEALDQFASQVGDRLFEQWRAELSHGRSPLRAAASLSRPQPDTIRIRGEDIDLQRFAYTLERTRNLVSGLPVRELYLDEEEFAGLVELITRAGGEPLGFRVTRSPEYGPSVAWREHAIRPLSRLPAVRPAGTLDCGGLPLRYTNQAGITMEVWPPWVETPTGQTARTCPIFEGTHISSPLITDRPRRPRARDWGTPPTVRDIVTGATWGTPSTPLGEILERAAGHLAELQTPVPRPARKAKQKPDPTPAPTFDISGPASNGRQIILRKKP